MKIKALKNLELKYILPLISAAAVLRKEKHLKKLLLFSKDAKIESNKIYEVLLQTYLFAGFPSALQSLKIFSEYFTPPKSKERYDQTQFLKRGRGNCKRVYGNKYKKLISNIRKISPELSEWLIIEGYGKTLSRSKLPMKERELCIVSILTVLGYANQLYSHIEGALRFSNSPEDISETLKNLSLLGKDVSGNLGLKILQEISFRIPASTTKFNKI